MFKEESILMFLLAKLRKKKKKPSYTVVCITESKDIEKKTFHIQYAQFVPDSGWP